ncbi:MAG: hypothetical protein IKH34_06495 [Oscillospiraceae bacterium]|nr:hypothetical protein [Oscillospiraceae bacterium]
MKKWTRFLAALLSLLMLLSLAACGASADKVVANLLGKNADALRQKDYKTAEDFYRAVELRRAKELVGILTGTANLETFNSEKRMLQNDLTVQLNQDALDSNVLSMLTSMAGVDLSWFKSAGLSFVAGKQNNLGAFNTAVLLNGKSVVSANVVLDNSSSTAYVSVPELTQQSFSVNLADFLHNNLNMPLSTSQLSQLLSGSWIDPMQVTSIFEKYYGIVLDNITKISVTDGTVTANGVSSKCSVAYVTLEGEDILRIAGACVSAAKTDADIEKIVYDFLTLSGQYSDSPSSFHAVYQAELQDVLDEIGRTDPSAVPYSIRMTVYIDAKGEILGRSVEIPRGEERRIVYSFLTAREGSKLGLEAELGLYSKNSYYNYKNQNVLTISGTGSYASSGKLEGDFLVRFSKLNEDDGNRDEFKLELGTLSANGTIERDGFIGELTLTPSTELLNLILQEYNMENAPSFLPDLIRSLTLSFVNKSSGEKTDLSLVLRTKGKDLLSISFIQAPTKVVNVSIPNNVTDLNSWVGSIGIGSLNTILNNLNSAGVPNALLNSLMG